MEQQSNLTAADIEAKKARRRELQQQWKCTAAEVLEMDFDEEGLWLIDKIVPKGNITIITGPSDVGKSSLLRQMAIAIANADSKFLGYNAYPDGKGVVFLASEDGWRGTFSGLKKQLAGLKIEPPPNLHFVVQTGDFVNKLTQELEKGEISTIFIDPWSNIYAGDPNAFIAVRNSLNRLIDLAVKHDAAVIMLHHNVKNSDKAKPDKNKLNGSQGIESTVRSVTELRLGEPQSNQRYFTLLKANYVDNKEKGVGHELFLDGETMLFTATGTTVLFGEDGKPRNSSSNAAPKQWGPVTDKLRFDETGQPLSLRNHRKAVQAAYPDDDVPSFYWFQQRYSKSNHEIDTAPFTGDDLATPLSDPSEIAADIEHDVDDPDVGDKAALIQKPVVSAINPTDRPESLPPEHEDDNEDEDYDEDITIV